jgi:hypothetical protein
MAESLDVAISTNRCRAIWRRPADKTAWMQTGASSTDMTDESAAHRDLHLVASPPFCLAAAANGWHTLADPEKAADGLEELRHRDRL